MLSVSIISSSSAVEGRRGRGMGFARTESSKERPPLSLQEEQQRWIYIVIVFADLAGLRLITFSDSLPHRSSGWIY